MPSWLLGAETRLSRVHPDTLVTEISLRNVSDSTISMIFGACSVPVRAYRDEQRTGRAAWDSERPVRGCEAIAILRRPGPGESLPPETFRRTVAVADFLGDSLPPGRYHFAVSLALHTDDLPGAVDDTFYLASGSARVGE